MKTEAPGGGAVRGGPRVRRAVRGLGERAHLRDPFPKGVADAPRSARLLPFGSRTPPPESAQGARPTPRASWLWLLRPGPGLSGGVRPS